MNKGELVAAVADKVGLSRGQAGEALDAAIDAITTALKKGDEVKIVGFGTFVVTNRAAGEARNPRTGEKVKVPASKTPKFRAGAGLKDAVNSDNRSPDRTFILTEGRQRLRCRPSVFMSEARAVSSVGRASRLHREGRRFEPVTAHQIGSSKAAGNRLT